MPERKIPPVRVLVVEDDPGEQRLLLEALRAGRVPKSISVAADGIEALAFLRRQGAHIAAPRPDLIIMPMMVPQGDGRVLSEIKSDPLLRQIPILILTSSRSEQDIDLAYDSRVNCYIVKPVEMDQFFAVVRAIEDFWMDVVMLPCSTS